MFVYYLTYVILVVCLLLRICQPYVRRRRGELPAVVGTKKANACVHTRLNCKEDIPYATVIEGEPDAYSRVRKKKLAAPEKSGPLAADNDVDFDDEEGLDGHRMVRMGREALSLPFPKLALSKKDKIQPQKVEEVPKKARKKKVAHSSESSEVSEESEEDSPESSQESNANISVGSGEERDIEDFDVLLDTVHYDPKDYKFYKTVDVDMYDKRQIGIVRCQLKKDGTWGVNRWNDVIMAGDIEEYTRDFVHKVEEIKHTIKGEYKDYTPALKAADIAKSHGGKSVFTLPQFHTDSLLK
jgi:hypothetical protein